jgi:hypothetical protein
MRGWSVTTFLRIAVTLQLYLSMIFSENRYPLFGIMLYSIWPPSDFISSA